MVDVLADDDGELEELVGVGVVEELVGALLEGARELAVAGLA